MCEQEQTIYTKTCEWCGKEFQTKKEDAHCCSLQCYGHVGAQRRYNKKNIRRMPFEMPDEEQFARVKAQRNLCRYKINMFTRELHKEQKMLADLVAKTEERAKTFDLQYHSRKEIDEAYICGKIETAREYSWHRMMLWRVYSDRGHNARIAWLEGEIAKYQKQLDVINEWKAEENREDFKVMLKEHNIRRNKKKHKKKYRKKKSQEMKRLKKAERKRELEARWEKYGITPSGRRKPPVPDGFTADDYYSE